MTEDMAAALRRVADGLEMVTEGFRLMAASTGTPAASTGTPAEQCGYLAPNWSRHYPCVLEAGHDGEHHDSDGDTIR